MINLIKTPQRADFKISYETDKDKLIIKIDNTEEIFDFTGLPEGRAESIEPEVLPINPIISAEKTGDTITVLLIQFYGGEEAHLYENTMEV